MPERLRDNGVECNATPRWVRGVVRRAEKQVIIHIDKEAEMGDRNISKITQLRKELAFAEVYGKEHGQVEYKEQRKLRRQQGM